MNSLLPIAAVSLGWIITGYPFAYLTANDRYERLGLAFLLGGGLTTVCWFIAYNLGFSLTIFSYTVVAIITWITGYVLSHRHKVTVTSKKDNYQNIDIFLIAVVVLALLSAFLIGSYNPLTAWDSLALYDFRAHAIAIDHNLKFMENSIYYLSYPLMISLSHALVYMIGGVSAQGLHAIFFASLIVVVYARLKEWTNLRFALIGAVLIAYSYQLFEHATFAYTNLPYVTYLIAGFCYLLSGKFKHVITGSLLIGLSSWIRISEPFWLLALPIVIWEAWKRKSLLQLLPLGLIFAVRYIWLSYYSPLMANLATAGVDGEKYSLDNIPRIINSIPAVISYLRTYIVYPYHGYWTMLIPISVFCFQTKNSRLIWLTVLSILTFGVVAGGVMIFSGFYTTWDQIGDSAKRMILYIVPLALVSGVYALYLRYDRGYGKNN